MLISLMITQPVSRTAFTELPHRAVSHGVQGMHVADWYLSHSLCFRLFCPPLMLSQSPNGTDVTPCAGTSMFFMRIHGLPHSNTIHLAYLHLSPVDDPGDRDFSSFRPIPISPNETSQSLSFPAAQTPPQINWMNK
jgi:hypothetical protein